MFTFIVNVSTSMEVIRSNLPSQREEMRVMSVSASMYSAQYIYSVTVDVFVNYKTIISN